MLTMGMDPDSMLGEQLARHEFVAGRGQRELLSFVARVGGDGRPHILISALAIKSS